jgi:hypothetical protein
VTDRARDLDLLPTNGVDDALEAAGGDAAPVCISLLRGLDREEASRALASAGSLRRALVRA